MILSSSGLAILLSWLVNSSLRVQRSITVVGRWKTQTHVDENLDAHLGASRVPVGDRLPKVDALRLTWQTSSSTGTVSPKCVWSSITLEGTRVKISAARIGATSPSSEDDNLIILAYPNTTVRPLALRLEAQYQQSCPDNSFTVSSAVR